MIKEIIASILEAIANIFKYSAQRSELKNSTDVKDAKKKQDETDKTNEMETAVKNRDVDKIRDFLAE
jgi:hypothetical protein